MRPSLVKVRHVGYLVEFRFGVIRLSVAILWREWFRAKVRKVPGRNQLQAKTVFDGRIYLSHLLGRNRTDVLLYALFHIDDSYLAQVSD